MMKLSLITSTLLFALVNLPGQTEKIIIEGAIIVGDSESSEPTVGSIRWTGSDFEGWNGLAWMSLTGNATVGTLSDIDSNSYRTIKIGDQHWMAENLHVQKYNDGGSIYHGSLFWPGPGQAAWCWYNDNNTNEPFYGKLYNWEAVNSGKLCPTGWHVPTYTELATLRDYLGGLLIAGGKMKQNLFNLWQSPNTGATNQSGFSGNPGGYRNANGNFANKGFSATWWSSTEANEHSANYFSLYYSNPELTSSFNSKTYGRSVRCVQD